MEFSRQEYWSGLPFPSPGDLPNPGIEPRSPALQADALLTEPPGKKEGAPMFRSTVAPHSLSDILCFLTCQHTTPLENIPTEHYVPKSLSFGLSSGASTQAAFVTILSRSLERLSSLLLFFPFRWGIPWQSLPLVITMTVLWFIWRANMYVFREKNSWSKNCWRFTLRWNCIDKRKWERILCFGAMK